MRDPGMYHVGIYGEPSTDKTWGGSFEGHHLSVNVTLVDGQRFCVTPSFFGSNPAQVLHGERAGLRALKEEEDLGRELLLALDGDQRREAVIKEDAPADLLNRYLFHFGNPGAIERDLGRYAKITAGSTSAWAKKVLKPNGRLILHVLPEEKKGGQP